MNTLPLLHNYQPSDYIAWKNGRPITVEVFLSEVASVLTLLPNKTHVINLCTDRYLFLLGFSAALIRGQTTLLPPNINSQTLQLMRNSYTDSYVLTDHSDAVDGNSGITLDRKRLPPALTLDNMDIPHNHIAAIAFTSGSTGTPRPNLKTWESLVSIAQKTYTRLNKNGSSRAIHIVATVPHQHMYGLETTIMLPIQHGWSFTSDRPFYPEDIRTALSCVPSERILVSTPIHLRACLSEQTPLPHTTAMLSATAPLPASLAESIESIYSTRIIEIYGFAEAGTIATREPVRNTQWTLLDGLTLSVHSDNACLETPYHSSPITIPDLITMSSPHEFLLEGRPKDLVNIGGHRASLEDLTHQLASIDGVIDAVYYSPPHTDHPVTRLMAFAVAPGKTTEEIVEILRRKVSPVFLPRPLYLVDALPRNPTGKLTAESLSWLVDRETGRKPCDAETTRP